MTAHSGMARSQWRHAGMVLACLASGLSFSAAAQSVSGTIQRPAAVVPKPAPAAPATVLPATPAAPTLVLPAPEVLPPGQLRDCPGCPLMVTVPAGEFHYGTPSEAREADPASGERPPGPWSWPSLSCFPAAR